MYIYICIYMYVCIICSILVHLRTLHQINERDTRVAKYLWLYSTIQSTCPGVLIGKHCIVVGANI